MYDDERDDTFSNAANKVLPLLLLGLALLGIALLLLL